MPKQLDSRSRGARAARLAFATLCVGAGVLSMSDIGWALRLKAEGYYADLQAELYGPEFVVAGTESAVTAHIFNNGPEPVEQYTLLLKMDGVVTVLAPGCERTYVDGVYSCVFDAPLPVYESATHDIGLRFHTSFEGATAVGMLATSPLFDPDPVNSFSVASMWVALNYDLRLEIDPDGARPGPDGPRLLVRVSNDGPSLAFNLHFETALSGEASGSAPFECITEHEGYCHYEPWVDLYPGGYVEFDVTLPTASATGLGYALEMRIVAPADADIDPVNNSATYRYSIPLFASGFE